MRSTRWDLEWDHASSWRREVARVDANGLALDADLPSTLSIFPSVDGDAPRPTLLAVPGVLIAHPRGKPGQTVRAVRFARTVLEVRELPPGYYEHEMTITYPTLGPQVIRGSLTVRNRLGMGRTA